MATSRNIQKELENLRKEMAALRQDYRRLKRQADTTTSEGADRFGTIRDGVAETIGAIRDNLAEGTGLAADGIGSRISEIRNVVADYSDKTERAVVAHPFATLAGAIAVGYLIGRIGRES